MNEVAKLKTLIEKGENYFDTKIYEKAITLWKEALEIQSKKFDESEELQWLYISIGDAYFFLENWEKSLEYFDLANNIEPDYGNPFIILRLGQNYYQLNDKEKSLEKLLKAYIIEGLDIFEDENAEYLSFLKKHFELE